MLCGHVYKNLRPALISGILIAEPLMRSRRRTHLLCLNRKRFLYDSAMCKASDIRYVKQGGR
jgi:hypothetical protein